MAGPKKNDTVHLERYISLRHYKKDANKLAKKGWVPAHVTHDGSGIFAHMYLVTYRKAADLQREATPLSATTAPEQPAPLPRPAMTDSLLDWFRWWRQRKSV